MGACYSTTSNSGSRRRRDGQHQDRRWWTSNTTSNRTSIDFNFTFAGGTAEEQIPGRLVANGSSTVATLHTQQGKKGINQDAMIVWEKFSSKSDAVFCGVFDGHGPYGHMVAKKVRDSLPVLLSTQWLNNTNIDQSCDNENSNANGSTHEEELLEEYWCEQSDNEEKETIPEKYIPLKKSLLKSFKLIDKELKNHPSIDCFCSGSTAVALIKQDQDLVIGNVGDSRAVMATRDEDNSLVAVQLTVDLKPNLPREAARIQQFKGRVFALQDEPEVSRVWLPNSDSPGLAMARAFGDFCLKDFGLISVPDVFYHRVTDRDEFVILATDGVWDVLSNKEAVEIVAAAPGRSTAARALVDCATRAWKLKYPTSKTDDCAAVCLFLDQKPKTVEKEVTKSDIDLVNQEAEVIKIPTQEGDIDQASDQPVVQHSDASRDCSEIELANEKLAEKNLGGSKRSLAECISTSEDEEWSALEGVARVNSLLSIPRFLSIDKRSNSWRKTASKI
ncbi:hypothetical protein OSB04_015282 [Centaurea solstitialis]|uniref:protein-serine/threonine phosphatase n=1 Tax=Centaurea solstitialis TaxID=347529 RepID=A0AA38W8S9_9ASTR|nr:hypothetical protein OSB04_015282 [Centaurea solstitialis]